MMDGVADIDLSMMTLKSDKKKKDEIFTILVAESVTTWYCEGS